MATPSQGVSGTLAVDDSAVTAITEFDANSKQYEFNSESLKMVQSHVDTGGIRGTRSIVKDRVRISQEAIGGSIVMNPTPIELDAWFPRILGAAESSDIFALAETLPVWSVLVDRGAKRHIYTSLYVDRATFTGAQGQLVSMTIDAIGKTEITSATSVPGTVPAIDSAQGYVFTDTTFALSADASATEVVSWQIVINNMIDPSKYRNSLTRTQIMPTSRMVTLSMVVPYTSDELDLYDQAVAGAAGTLTLTNGLVSTLFTFANLKAPAESPVITGRGNETFLNLNMQAFMSSSTRELVITHDSNAAA